MKRYTSSLSLAIAGWLAISAPLHAQSNDSKAPTTPAPSRPPKQEGRQDISLGQIRVVGRVHVGAPVPDFTALSSSGRELTISRQRGDWLLLLFAEAREDFNTFRELHQDLRSTGAVVLGVSKEKPQRLRAIVERDSLPFELLADDTGDISALYGFYDLQRRFTTPGFVLVDRQGVVRMALQGQAPPDQIAALTRFTIVGF
jgi:peroxiredoxin Q/BCP